MLLSERKNVLLPARAVPVRGVHTQARRTVHIFSTVDERTEARNIAPYCFAKLTYPITLFIIIVSIRAKLASMIGNRRKATGCRYRGQVPRYMGYIDK